MYNNEYNSKGKNNKKRENDEYEREIEKSMRDGN